MQFIAEVNPLTPFGDINQGEEDYSASAKCTTKGLQDNTN